MSPKELAESGVMGLDADVLQSDLTSPDSETQRSCEDASDTSVLYDKSPCTREGPVQCCPEEHRTGILRELRCIQALEEQITEEHLKLEALRCRETESLDLEELLPDQVREMERGDKVKKRSSKDCKVVTCSVMERNSTLEDLDDELLRSCGLQSHTHTEKTSSDLGLNADCTSPNPASLTSEPASTASLGRLDSESLRCCHSASSGFSGKPEESSAVPHICPEDEASLPETGDACSTRDSADVRGAFDPGGVSIAPWMPKDGVCQRGERRPADCEAQASVVLSKLVQHNNNNNNTAVLCVRDSPGSSDCDGSMRAASPLHASSRQVQLLKHWETPVAYHTLIS